MLEAQQRRPKLLYLITADWFFCSHFMERAVAASHAGYDVIVAAKEIRHAQIIRNAGLAFASINFVRRGVNPATEFRTVIEILRLYRKESPDVVHHIGAKPILYGSLAACLSRVPSIVNASIGMGYVFTARGFLARFLKPLVVAAYRFLLNPDGSKVIFENSDDLSVFVRMGAVRAQDSVLIRGAGIDLARYRQHEEPAGVPVVVLVARMLRDKGVVEFVQAAHHLHDQGIQARFLLVGDSDPENPSSIPEECLQAWHGRKGVEWWGWRSDVAEVLASAHIACLPSYREGLPKSLLEAAAAGLPIVTTDAVGCREAVLEGESGLLVPVGDAIALAEALRRLIVDPELRRKMGERGREYAQKEFSSERVITETLAVYATLTSHQRVA